MTYADHVMNFVTYGFLMLALCGVIGALHYWFYLPPEARHPRRRGATRDSEAEDEPGEEAPPYPKKTSASA